MEILTDQQKAVLECVRKRNLHLRIQMSEAEIGLHFSLIFCNFTPINRKYTLLNKGESRFRQQYDYRIHRYIEYVFPSSEETPRR